MKYLIILIIAISLAGCVRAEDTLYLSEKDILKWTSTDCIFWNDELKELVTFEDRDDDGLYGIGTFHNKEDWDFIINDKEYIMIYVGSEK